jgi:Fe2+ or Zn2+ uptake regulation protein
VYHIFSFSGYANESGFIKDERHLYQELPCHVNIDACAMQCYHRGDLNIPFILKNTDKGFERMHHFVRASDEVLRKRGYRLTPQRHMILSVIQEANEHLSIEQITERVQQRNPYVSLSTVYRTLELLRELGLVRESHLFGEQPHYEAVGGHAHLHLICRRCRMTIHLDDELLGNLHEQLQAQYHFHGMMLDLVAAGYCDPCWQLMQQEEQKPPDDKPSGAP